MNRYSTRDYKYADYSEVMKIWQELGLSSKARGDNHDTIKATIENGGKFILLIDNQNNEIIGTSWISNDKRRLYLHHFGIKKSEQGKGLSHYLLDESIRFAKNLNMQLKLEVHTQNITAVNLYKNAGFDYLGDYDVYIIRDIKNARLFLE